MWQGWHMQCWVRAAASRLQSRRGCRSLSSCRGRDSSAQPSDTRSGAAAGTWRGGGRLGSRSNYAAITVSDRAQRSSGRGRGRVRVRVSLRPPRRISLRPPRRVEHRGAVTLPSPNTSLAALAMSVGHRCSAAAAHPRTRGLGSLRGIESNIIDLSAEAAPHN